jgi:hypothetical protein
MECESTRKYQAGDSHGEFKIAGTRINIAASEIVSIERVRPALPKGFRWDGDDAVWPTSAPGKVAMRVSKTNVYIPEVFEIQPDILIAVIEAVRNA